MPDFTIIARKSDGSASAYSVTEISHSTVYFMPEDNIVSVEAVGVGMSRVIANFVPQCLPEHPFYIRWINDIGGWEYMMFSQNKTFTSQIEDAVIVNTPVLDTPIDNRTQLLMFANGMETVSVGVDGIDYKEYKRLAGVKYSNKIEWYNKEVKKWIGIIMSGNASTSWNTASQTGTFEITFRLCDRIMPF